MTTLTTWLSPTVMHSLGWALVHFLWQGTALAAMAAVTTAVFRRASVRYAIGVSILVLMLASPIATFVILATPPPADFAPSTAPVMAIQRASQGSVLLGAASAIPASTPASDAFPWLVEAWLVGVALFSLRTAGGFLLLERQQRRASVSVKGDVLNLCRSIQQRVGLDRAVRFCECAWLQAPAVIGWFRPVVLLPIAALTKLSPEQLESVIAHELAHIRRYDAFVNVFQVCLESLLFYHPAVWWLNQRIRAEREHCCDDIAIETCGNAVEYARALTVMEQWREAPALVMAANRGPLRDRIVHLLGLKPACDTARRTGLAASIFCLGAALLAGNALIGIAYPKPIYAATTLMHRLGVRLPVLAAQAQPATQPKPATKPSTAAKPSPAQSAQPVQSPQPVAEPVKAQSYIESMKATGVGDLSLDDLIALKIQGVTPEYVHGLQEAGLHPDGSQIIAMKVQGINPEYIKEMHSIGFNPDIEQLIALKVQGVSADYVHGLKEAGIQGDADEIIGLKVQGVTPDYVRGMRAAGLKVDDEGDVIGLKVQGVTPDYVKALRDQGLNPGTDDIIGMKVQGVTPEYISGMRAAGLKLSEEQVISLRVQGVTPEYVKALRATGMRDFGDDGDCYVAAKIQGITPEFIAEAQKHGFKDLDLDKLIQLRHLGILDSKGDI